MVARVLEAEDPDAADRLAKRIDWPGAMAFAALLAEGRSAERAELAGWSEPEEGVGPRGKVLRHFFPQEEGVAAAGAGGPEEEEAAEDGGAVEEEEGDGGAEEGGPASDA